MPNFSIQAQPSEAWGLELRGSDDVQFNGRLLQECMIEAINCADQSGCLEAGNVRLTDLCAQTLERHMAESD